MQKDVSSWDHSKQIQVHLHGDKIINEMTCFCALCACMCRPECAVSIVQACIPTQWRAAVGVTPVA